MAVGKLDLMKYRESDGSWILFKSGVTLSQGDSHVRHGQGRFALVHNGQVLAATRHEDLDLAFDDIETITIAC